MWLSPHQIPMGVGTLVRWGNGDGELGLTFYGSDCWPSYRLRAIAKLEPQMICWPYSQDIQRQFDGTVAQCRLMLLLSLVVLLRVAAIAVVAAGVVVAAVVLLIVMVGMLQQLLVLVWLGMLLLLLLQLQMLLLGVLLVAITAAASVAAAAAVAAAAVTSLLHFTSQKCQAKRRPLTCERRQHRQDIQRRP